MSLAEKNIAAPSDQQPEKRDLHRFNPENCDIRTQIIFEDWCTVPMLRIVTILLARKGGALFGVRGIAEMIGVSKSSTHEAVEKMVAHGYLSKVAGKYRLIIGEIQQEGVRNSGQSAPQVSGKPDGVSGIPDRSVRFSGQSVRNSGHNNDKEQLEKNNDKEQELSLPSKFDNPEVWRWVRLWDKKLRQQGRKLDQIQLEALCSTYQTPQLLRDALRHTCSLTSARNVVPAPEPRTAAKKAHTGEKPPPRRISEGRTELTNVGDILKGVITK